MFNVGVDVGGMSIKAGVTTIEGDIIAKGIVETRIYDQTYSISQDIHKAISLALTNAGITLDAVGGIGIGHPGSIDSVRGIIRYSNNIALANVPVIQELRAIYGNNLPILINNDANCAALGEYLYGSGKGSSDVVFITLGTGVGSGIIINHNLFEGRECAGAEAGHTVIVKDGNPCNCGRHGCWETYASVTALINQTRLAMANHPDSLLHSIAEKEGKISGKTSFIAAKAGDSAGVAVVAEYLDYIAEGLLNIANVFRPETIIIGGGISYEGEYLTAPLNQKLARLTFGWQYNPPVTVKAALLANDAGLLGASALLLKK